VKVLVDMNLSPRWAEALRGAGFEAVHWSSIGPREAPDTELLDYARAQEFVVLTHDLDFAAILSASAGAAPSVVQIRAANLSPETLAPLVARALRQTEHELASGALLTIEPHRMRLRLLPLNPAG
jgi:predicted nuclease of predicted toxin-antitoxin system